MKKNIGNYLAEYGVVNDVIFVAPVNEEELLAHLELEFIPTKKHLTYKLFEEAKYEQGRLEGSELTFDKIVFEIADEKLKDFHYVPLSSPVES